MRRVMLFLLIVAAPAFAVACAILLLGASMKYPAFVARTTFAVDWGKFPSSLVGKDAEKARATWRAALAESFTNLPRSREDLNALLDSVNYRGTPAQREAAISRTSNRLHLAVQRQSDTLDYFTIEAFHNDSTNALGLANLVLQFEVARTKLTLQLDSGEAAIRSYKDIQDIARKKEEISRRAFAARNSSAGQSDAGAEQRPQDSNESSEQLEIDHMFAGFGLLANLVGAFGSDAVSVVEPAHAARTRGGYQARPFAQAAGAAAIVGLSGLLLFKRVTRRKKTPATATPSPTTHSLPPIPTAPLR